MKLNAWKNKELPSLGYFIPSKKPYAKGKELFKNCFNVGWTPIEDGICFIGDKNAVDNIFIKKEIVFFDLDINAQIRLTHSFFKAYLQKIGFTYSKRGDLFYLKSSVSKLQLRISKAHKIYVNLGLKYSIEVLSNRIILLINPYQVTTPDGENYSSKFSQINNPIVLSDEDLAPSYNHFCNMYEAIISLINKDTQGNIILNCFDSGQYVLEESKTIEPPILEEPDLFFGVGKLVKWPKLGLDRYHPLDYNTGSHNRPEFINLVLVGSRNSFNMLKQLKNGQQDVKYPYKGFDNIYQSILTMGEDRFVNLTENEINSVKSIYDIADLVISKIVELRNKNIELDICLIELQKEWEEFFSGQERDLRDLIKAKAWSEKISTQLFKYSERNTESELTDLLNHLGLGIYYKAGGNPWRINSLFHKVAYVGISFGYSEIDKKRLIGVAEIFDTYGQFISVRSLTIKEKELDEIIHEKRDIHLAEGQLSQLLQNLLKDYYSYMDEEFPDHLVVHKTTYFNKIEKADIETLTSFPTSITLVYTQDKSDWHIISSDHKEPIRGIYLELTDTKALVYTSGIMQGQKSYFLPGSPKPYLIHVYEGGAFSLKQLCEQLMELTKLNFNSTNTYSRHPVTTLHAKKLVDLLRAGLNPQDFPYDPRYYI